MNSYSFGDIKTVCGLPEEWDDLAGVLDSDKAASVVDLRTGSEIGEASPPEVPEAWNYRRLPVSGDTVSEQDVDVLRREQLRSNQTVVLSPNGARGPLMVLAGEARKARRDLEKDELKDVKDQSKEKALRSWLDSYLERHKTTTPTS